MKVSIWQQFSSNHSNSFTVVGKFKTESDAHLAYLQIRRVLRRIVDAHRTNPPAMKVIPDDIKYGFYPSEAELEILAPLGVIPKHLSDWTIAPHVTSDDLVHYAVRYFDNYVIFCNVGLGWSGANTFEQLMATFTDVILSNEELDLTNTLATHIRCEAPDEQTAQSIYDALVAHQQNSTNRNSWGTQMPIAWLTHYDGEYNSEYEKWIPIEEQYLKHERWRKQQWELNKTLKELPKDMRSTFQDKIDDHAAKEPPEIDYDESSKIVHMRWELQFRNNIGNISIDDSVVVCKNLVFGLRTINRGVPAIVSWMRANGCKVEYQFRITQLRTEATVKCLAVDEITAKRIVEQIRLRQTEALVLSDGEVDYFLTARDTVTSLFNEVTIHIYDYQNKYPFERFLKSLGCRRIRTQRNMIANTDDVK